MINYDDFAKLEITIGEIRAVDVVDGADKLLKLTVDFGEEKSRQIISGIRLYFEDPHVLVGKKCPFLTNLEHRTIRGFESEGMLLAAHADDVFALLLPSADLPRGTRVV
jgi:methionyl-tRNA synthetase